MLEDPTFKRSDATVIIPTVEPNNVDFRECLDSVCANGPGEIIVVTVGPGLLSEVNRVIARQAAAFPRIRFTVTSTDVANKRQQVAHALPLVRTPITLLVDDHVIWPSTRFLPSVLAPFEDGRVGVVGTNKRVRREPRGVNWRSFWNMIGCLYLERHNFEIRATNTIDGGVFVISGRTSAHLSKILTDADFIRGFKNELFFFDQFGPLNADDDNFITRWEVKHGWDIKIQYTEDSMIETTLGTYPKFLSQALRWVRTTWRSNSASLFSPANGLVVWWKYPWCVYAVFLTSFTNFALFYDAAMLWTLIKTTWFGEYGWDVVKLLAAWVFISKMVKPFPHFWRNPSDLLLLPGYILFGYLHSLIKLYAGLTFWVTAWGGRDLKKVEADSFQKPDSDSDSSDGDDDDTDDDNPGPGVSVYNSTANDNGYTVEDADAETVVARSTPARSLRTTPDRKTVQTPWGSVTTRSLHKIPANVGERSASRLIVRSTRLEPVPSTFAKHHCPHCPADYPVTRSSRLNTRQLNSCDCRRQQALAIPKNYRPSKKDARVTFAYPSPPLSDHDAFPFGNTHEEEPYGSDNINKAQLTFADRVARIGSRVPYNRTFERVQPCERIHADQTDIVRGRCTTKSVWEQ